MTRKELPHGIPQQVGEGEAEPKDAAAMWLAIPGPVNTFSSLLPDQEAKPSPTLTPSDIMKDKLKNQMCFAFQVMVLSTLTVLRRLRKLCLP